MSGREMHYVDLQQNFADAKSFYDLVHSFNSPTASCELSAKGEAQVKLPYFSNETLLFETVVDKVTALAMRIMDEGEKPSCIQVIERVIAFSEILDAQYLLGPWRCCPTLFTCSRYYPSALAKRRVQLMKREGLK